MSLNSESVFICPAIAVEIDTRLSRLKGGDFLLFARGARGVPAFGGRLPPIHAPEEGEPSREPARSGTRAFLREPGAHHQERGQEIDHVISRTERSYWGRRVWICFYSEKLKTLKYI